MLHKSLPMPITSHEFSSIDPIAGSKTDDDSWPFVLSLCWKEKSDTCFVAANSSGVYKSTAAGISPSFGLPNLKLKLGGLFLPELVI